MAKLCYWKIFCTSHLDGALSTFRHIFFFLLFSLRVFDSVWPTKAVTHNFIKSLINEAHYYMIYYYKLHGMSPTATLWIKLLWR